MFDSNRRKYPRANYPCQLTMWPLNGDNVTILANSANIGVGGLAVALNHPVDLGTKMDIQINFSNPTTPFKCSGVVVRSRKESDKYYNIGIQFDPLGELKLAFLEGKVAELIELEQRGQV